MSDAILMLSVVFFGAMVLIPLWGPYVFFPDREQERKDQERERAERDRQRQEDHHKWMAEWKARLDGIAALEQKRHNQIYNGAFTMYLKDQYDKERERKE